MYTQEEQEKEDQVLKKGQENPPRIRTTSEQMERIPFVKILEEADEKTKTTTASGKIQIYDSIKVKFGGESLSEAFSNLEGASMQVCLVLFNLLFPDMRQALETIASIPLKTLQSTESALTYLGALIKSGIAAESDSGVVYVMGNTNVGKSSLVNTFVRFMKSPFEKPVSVLTQDHEALRETQVMEIYNDVQFKKALKLNIGLEPTSENPQVQMMNFKEPGGHGSETKRLKLRLIDFGGHTEYFTCSSLFMISSGVFLICFDGCLLLSKNIGDHYYSWVGCYIDLINDVSIGSNIKPKIMLAVTKLNSIEGGPSEEVNKACEDILRRARKHLVGMESKNPIYLADEVLQTSSKYVTEQNMIMMYRKFEALCSDKAVNNKPAGATPAEYHHVLDEFKDEAFFMLEEFSEAHKRVRAEVRGVDNISEEQLEMFEKFKEVIQDMHAAKFEDDIDKATGVKKKLVEQVAEEEHTDSEESLDGSLILEPEEATKLGETKTFQTLVNLPIEISGSEEDIDSKPGTILEDDTRKVLEYFQADNTILWFDGIENLRDTVIPKPMTLIKSFRWII